MAAPRAASTPPRTPTARAKRGGSSSGRRTEVAARAGRRSAARLFSAYSGSATAGNFEGDNILHLAGGAEAAEPDGLDAASPRPSTRPAPSGSARARRQAADRLERADDRGPRRGRRRARPRGLPRGRPAQRRVRARRRCARRGPAAAHLQGRPRPAQRLPRGPRLLCSTACWRSTKPPSSRAGSTRAGPRRDDHRAFVDPERGGFFDTSADHER